VQREVAAGPAAAPLADGDGPQLAEGRGLGVGQGRAGGEQAGQPGALPEVGRRGPLAQQGAGAVEEIGRERRPVRRERAGHGERPVVKHGGGPMTLPLP
jgi:hypothetical protein